jgi:hypothetical protein
VFFISSKRFFSAFSKAFLSFSAFLCAFFKALLSYRESSCVSSSAFTAVSALSSWAVVAASVGVSSVDVSSSAGTSSFAAIEMLLVLLSAVMFCETSLLLALGTIFGGIRIERTRAESSSYIAKYERERHTFRWLIKWCVDCSCGVTAPVH